MLYILLGPPASGKGTQSELLAKHLKIPHISTGALLRELKDTNPEIGQLIDNGKIVPDECLREIYARLAKQYPGDLILDGAIRSQSQADIIVAYWKPENIQVIWLDISDAIILARSQHRDTITKEKRPDDRLSIVPDRIAYYHESKPQIIARLQQHHIAVTVIDGSGSIDSVQAAILKAIR
jgi:adenylate kinase